MTFGIEGLAIRHAQSRWRRVCEVVVSLQLRSCQPIVWRRRSAPSIGRYGKIIADRFFSDLAQTKQNHICSLECDLTTILGETNHLGVSFRSHANRYFHGFVEGKDPGRLTASRNLLEIHVREKHRAVQVAVAH